MAFAHTLCHWTSERGWRPGANPTWQHSKPFAPSTESQCVLCLNKWHDQYEKKHDMKPGDIISKLKHPARPRQNWDVPRSQSKGRKLMYPSDLMLILWVQKCWNGSCQLRMGLHHPENVSGVKNAISVSWIVSKASQTFSHLIQSQHQELLCKYWGQAERTLSQTRPIPHQRHWAEKTLELCGQEQNKCGLKRTP